MPYTLLNDNMQVSKLVICALFQISNISKWNDIQQQSTIKNSIISSDGIKNMIETANKKKCLSLLQNLYNNGYFVQNYSYCVLVLNLCDNKQITRKEIAEEIGQTQIKVRCIKY